MPDPAYDSQNQLGLETYTDKLAPGNGSVHPKSRENRPEPEITLGRSA